MRRAIDICLTALLLLLMAYQVTGEVEDRRQNQSGYDGGLRPPGGRGKKTAPVLLDGRF